LFAPGLISDREGAVKKKGTKTRFGMDAKMTEGMFSLSHVIVGNQEKAKEHGAELHFGMAAQQLVLKNERVVGVIAKDDDGQYIKYNANKGVILATGDFGGNKKMCHDLLPDMVDMFEEGEQFRSLGRDGRGIQMAVWAGGRLEPRPLAAMGGNTTVPSGVLASSGTLWTDENGKRFCNENFGDPVFTGFPGAISKHGVKTIIFDSGIFEDLQSSPPSRMAFWVNNEDAEKELYKSMAAARTAGSEGYRIGNSRLYAAEDIETLVSYIGLQGKAEENFLNTIRRYNDFCSTGRDMEFGKDSQLLHAIDNPPYYAQTLRDSMIGYFLVTVGGLLTDEYQNVLNRKKEPIPGLYATGNCCGRRFGPQYSTPIAGVSIGIAITLGREVGKIVAKL
jgi:fumarate reductase flavoprotein subunit